MTIYEKQSPKQVDAASFIQSLGDDALSGALKAPGAVPTKILEDNIEKVNSILSKTK